MALTTMAVFAIERTIIVFGSRQGWHKRLLMNIWLISAYGPIPGEGWRDYRVKVIGDFLTEAGHNVLWWTPNFSHHFKRFRSEGWDERLLSPRFRLRLVPTTPYSRNIGLARLRYEALFAWRVYRRAFHERPPECIIVGDPPQIVGWLGVRLARHFQASLVIDVIDLWPELFAIAFPRWARGLAHLLLSPLRFLRSYNYRQADALTASNETYRLVALEESRGSRTAPITVFNSIDVERFRGLMKTPWPLLDSVLPHAKDPREVWAVFAGTLGQNYDVETLLRASVLLGEGAPQVKILIAGEGPLLPRVRQFVRDHVSHNVIYIGKIPAEALPALYAQCDIGLCAYGPGSTVAMPDKGHDYMAAGLPIVSSLKGELERLLQSRRIGIQYAAGDARSLAASLELLAGDGSLRRELAQNSYECAAQFDRRIQYSRFVAAVEKTRGKGVPKPPAQEAARQVESNGCADLRSAYGAPNGVRRACPQDITEIVAIHGESFPGFFLSFLGPRFLRVLYESIVDHERGAAFVYLDNGELAAFVAGVTNPSAFYRALIKHRLPAFMWAAMSAALRRPQIILRLFRALLYPSQTPRGDAIATLMSIGTRPKCQGRGIGRQLVEAFLAEMNRRGVRCVNLTTDRQNNDEANAFYRKLGFTLVRTYGTPEHRQMNEYEYVLGRR